MTMLIIKIIHYCFLST